MCITPKKLSTKILLHFCVLATLALALVYFLIFSYLEKSMLEIYYEKLITAREVKKTQILTYFTTIDKQLQTLSQNPYLHGIVAPLGSKQLSKELQTQLRNYLQSYTQDTQLQNLYILDKEAKEVLFQVYSTKLSHTFLPKLQENKELHFIDFQTKEQTRDKPAAYLVDALFLDGKRELFLVAQIGVAPIDAIMTNNKEWLREGYQKTGETYVIGSDCTMRNNSRFLVEDSQGYLQVLQKRYDASLLQQIQKYNTTILLQPVEGRGCDAIKEGRSGQTLLDDYRGVRVLSAYTPVDIFSTRWGILSEIDEAEVYRVISAIEIKLLLVILFVFTMIVLSTLFFTRVALRQFEALKAGFHTLASGDLSYRVPVYAKDEFGALSQTFNESLQQLEELDLSVKHLSQLSYTDTLTKLYNRRKIDEVLLHELRRFTRKKFELSLILFDIDHFKKINDTYGHDVGDYALQELSALFSKHIRTTDFFARWGGEEFMIVLFDTDLESAILLANNLRRLVREYPFKHFETMRCSFGVTQLKVGDTIESFIQRADSALYDAKDGGRDRVKYIR